MKNEENSDSNQFDYLTINMARSHNKGAQKNALYITLDGGEYSY